MFNEYQSLLNIVYSQIGYESDKVINEIELALVYALNKFSVEEYVKSEYQKIMSKWVKDTGNVFKIPNGSISLSIGNNQKIINLGNANNDNLYDIASMTKLYTEIILFKMLKDYKLSLDMPVKKIRLLNGMEASSLYANLFDDMTLRELISFDNEFSSEIITDGKTPKEAKEKLRTSTPDINKRNIYKYTDFPIMILSDILENVSGMTYEELLSKYILNDLNLKNTYYYNVPDDKKTLYTGINKNGVNDPKSNALMGGGHAGIITNSEDLTTFLTNTFSLLGENEKYFTSSSDLNYKTGMPAIDIAKIGNSNININDDSGNLARITLPKRGFYVQGSTRVDGDSAVFSFNNKEYPSSANILIDVHNQLEEHVNYRIKGSNLTKSQEEYISNLYNSIPDDEFSSIVKGSIKSMYVEDRGLFITNDLRSVLQYNGKHFSELKDMVGTARIIYFYETLLKEYGKDELINLAMNKAKSL